MTADRDQMDEGTLARRLYELEVAGAERLVELARGGERQARPAAPRPGRRRRTVIGGGLLAAALVLGVAMTSQASKARSKSRLIRARTFCARR